MHKPELIETTDQGGTIHRYQISGGRREFTRFLACYLGNCQFFGDIQQAQEQLKKMEPNV